MREPERWVAARRAEVVAGGSRALGNLRELFGRQPWRSRALLGLALATVGLATYGGSSPGARSWSA